MDWNAAGPAAIVGAVVATIGVFAVELWFKPELARKRVARVLLLELRLNREALRNLLEHREENPYSVPETVASAQHGWTAVSSEIHYLPSDALRTVLLVYAQLTELDRVVRSFSRKTDLVLQIGPGSAARALFNELQDDSGFLGPAVERTIAQIERTLPYLQTIVDEGPPDRLPDA